MGTFSNLRRQNKSFFLIDESINVDNNWYYPMYLLDGKKRRTRIYMPHVS